MKDLSREEKLRRQISALEEAYEKRKWMRVKKTFLVLSGVIYLIAFMCNGMNDTKDYITWLLGAPIAAGLVMLISILVLLYIITGGAEEEKIIAKKMGELEAIKFSDKK